VRSAVASVGLKTDVLTRMWKGWCGKAGVERLLWKVENKKGKLPFPLSKQAINRFLLLLSFLLLSFLLLFIFIFIIRSVLFIILLHGR
jgi:hypothetical protein